MDGRLQRRLLKGCQKNQAEFNYYEEKVPAYVLPDVLVTEKGKKVRSAGMWEKIRRNEDP